MKKYYQHKIINHELISHENHKIMTNTIAMKNILIIRRDVIVEKNFIRTYSVGLDHHFFVLLADESRIHMWPCLRRLRGLCSQPIFQPV